MYRTTMTETATSFSESKYVADILRNMANGDPAVTGATYSISPYVSGITSVSTPTLTPTTLANIEQTFIELQSVPVNPSSGQDPLTQSGFVPPIVSIDPVSDRSDNSRYDEFSDSSDDPEWDPAAKKARTTQGNVIYQYNGDASSSPKRKRRGRNDKLSPEEDARRSIRRERNKVAAAKCRQRRVDHTNRLLEETDKLEGEKGNLENEILSLQQQKDQLEFILQAHQPMCTETRSEKLKVKTEPGTSPCSRNSLSSATLTSAGRPASLPIVKQEKTEVSSVTGIPISTPSTGFYTFTLDSIVDSTGLTPLTGHPPATCSGEQRSSSESGSDYVSSPTLISL